ncbi:MAG: hypothetical protein K0R39_517 [Symbiobacteriaceae bacterium]|nr:hypothetical protein [Symbiobacteriaceae bacterium]
MRHAIALGLKLAVYLVIFVLTRPMVGTGLPQWMILAAVHTLLLWFADLVVLPRLGNLVALFGDIVTLFVGTSLVAAAFWTYPSPSALLIAVVAGAAFEWWFHNWLLSTATVE